MRQGSRKLVGYFGMASEEIGGTSPGLANTERQVLAGSKNFWHILEVINLGQV